MTSPVNPAAFVPLRAGAPGGAQPISAVRGIRVPVGPRGTYVGFGGGRFFYRVKLDGAPLSPHEVSPDVVIQDLEQRARYVNLFKVYLWVAGVLLVFCLAAGAAFFVFLLLFAVGAFFVRRWDRERRTARILYDVDSGEIVTRLGLCNAAGEALARTNMLWHVFSSTNTLARKYHAGAGTLVGRAATRCSRGWLDGVEVNIDCWSVAIGPQQLLFLPDRLLFRMGSRYASFPYEGLTVVNETTRFVEEGPVPSDGQVVDSTWRFVNKSGGPDLRFNGNRQIPVLLYGELTLRAPNGAQVVIQASNLVATRYAAAALQELARVASASVDPRSAGLPPAPPSARIPATPPQQPPSARIPPAPPAPPAPVRQPPPAPPTSTGPRGQMGGQPPTTRQPSVPPPLPGPTRSSADLEAWARTARAEQGLSPPAPALPPRVRVSTQLLPSTRAAPPPLPPIHARLRVVADGATSAARFVGTSEPLSVAGRVIPAPLTYVSADKSTDLDASTIVLSLRVGDASRAPPLPYWPSYSGADPEQRGKYLDWMAGGRADAAISIGYVFIFFYGLERRVLVDRAHWDEARAEVIRLLELHSGSGSFRCYASDFLAFAEIRDSERFGRLSEAEVISRLGPFVADSATSLAALTAWYFANGRPLPAEYAAVVVRNLEEAKRSPVVTRSAAELADLFSIRYRETFGDGIVLEAAKRPLTVEYRPASATLLAVGRSITATLPDVFGRSGQFRKLVSLWNDCIDDLRKANARKRGAKELDAAAWSALPPELRAEYDHPDQDRWDSAIAATPVLAGFHLVRAGQLGALYGLQEGQKLTPAQMKKIAARATEVGYALEPEPRLRSKAADAKAELLVWRASSAELPDAKIHSAVFAMLSLAMTVAMADGVFAREEEEIVGSFLSELFVLDDGMRTRVEAMKQLMARDPSRLGAVAKVLKETRTPRELAKVAAVLVAIAAADGVIAEVEEKALRALYRNLGLPAGDLAGAIARTGARLERDAPVQVQPATVGVGGVPIPPPPDAAPAALRLDQAAIDAIVADTKEVAAILTEVFDPDDTQPPSSAVASIDETPAPLPALPRASDATTSLAAGLDVRYHAVLEELLGRETWGEADVRALAARHRLMPVAILDSVNAWSDEVFGDFLIEESGSWTVKRALAKGTA